MSDYRPPTSSGGAGVASYNARTGAVTSEKTDITSTGLTGADIGALEAINNLADVDSTTTARTNLGLGGAATLNVGTSAGTVAAGNDPRFTRGLQFGLAMPGTCTVRVSTTTLIAPFACTVAGFYAVLSSGAGTVVQLVHNGTGIGTSGSLTTTASETSFAAVAVAAGDLLTLSIITAGTGSDLTVMIVGTET